MKETKKALIVSGLSLALCFVLMAGMTFAWFTDSVVNKGNNITSGTLAADLLMDESKSGTYSSIANQEGSIFSDGEGENGYNWEPDKTEVVFLAVGNDGQLDLKYNLDMDITGELAGSLEYALIPGATAEKINGKTWEDIKALAGAQTGDAGTDIYLREDRQVNANTGGEKPLDYFALAIHMTEDAPNDVQGKSANINIEVKATQIEQETGN